MKDDVHACVAAEAGIGFKCPRVPGEILAWAKLGRIDKNTDYDLTARTGKFAGSLHERSVTGMEGAHRGNEHDPGPPAARGGREKPCYAGC